MKLKRRADWIVMWIVALYSEALESSKLALIASAKKFTCSLQDFLQFLYARRKTGRIMLWRCPSVRPSVRPSVVIYSFPDFFLSSLQL
jgi:hypothetical protein